MTGEPLDDSELRAPCNMSDATTQSLIAIDFWMKAASYSFPNCKGNVDKIVKCISIKIYS